MAEPKIIAEFPKCPSCGSEEKISELGCTPQKLSGKIAPDTFTTLEQRIVPVEAPVFAGVSVPCIVTFFDVCAKCGTWRCTRAVIINAPIQQGAPPMPSGGRSGGAKQFRG